MINNIRNSIQYYIGLPLIVKFIITTLILVIGHFGVKSILTFGLFNYTYHLGIPFPSSSNFDISLLYPPFYLSTIINLVLVTIFYYNFYFHLVLMDKNEQSIMLD